MTGKELKEFREKRSITPAEMARALEISESTILYWENEHNQHIAIPEIISEEIADITRLAYEAKWKRY